ncbi:GDYXXLXY domain-containing protein [Hymenobacter koreensis]|uniref:GDYXXLXY domain-containing protein n=1 Tax=Hymenobacter koreensis TaxID=1084523 RepID=A0ABP8JKN4_9BACT
MATTAPSWLDPTAAVAPDRQRRWRQLAVALQVAFILAVAAAGYATGYFGQAITLRTTPVDPRDLLYGDYVVLNFSISQLPAKLWRGPQRPRVHQPVYIELRPGPDGAYEAVAIHAAPPGQLPADHAVLRGWVQNSWRSTLRIRYGLERYYVPEGSGRKLERAAGRRELLVQVRVAPWSQARIVGISGL